MLADTEKSVYEQVVYESEVERSFAKELEMNDSVKVYAKLPAWFEVGTPLGPYHPDWAVLIVKDDREHLYFVVETKGALFAEALRATEAAKIHCGEAHVQSLANGDHPASFRTVTKLDDLLASA
jgi:type III restriction enzyme